MTQLQYKDMRYYSPDEALYIVGNNWEFAWLPSEVKNVIKYVGKGYKLPRIALKMDRSYLELLLLLLELKQQRKITLRIDVGELLSNI